MISHFLLFSLKLKVILHIGWEIFKWRRYSSLCQRRYTFHTPEYWITYWRLLHWNIRNKKWLLVYTYNPNKNLISNHLKEIDKTLDNYSSKYGNFILLGNLNSESAESPVRDFCQIYGYKNLIKHNTCFENLEKPSCIDLIITNRTKMLSKFCEVRNWVVRFS